MFNLCRTQSETNQITDFFIPKYTYFKGNVALFSPEHSRNYSIRWITHSDHSCRTPRQSAKYINSFEMQGIKAHVFQCNVLISLMR